MENNIYLIGEEKDIEKLSFCFTEWGKEGKKVITITIKELGDDWTNLIDIENAVFCLSSSTPDKVYDLALERFWKKNKSINIFIEPFKLTEHQKECIGRNKSLFLYLDDNKASDILKVICSKAEWKLFFPDYQEEITLQSQDLHPKNQYDEDGNLILPVYDEPKKGKLGIILGIIAAIIITAGGIVGYHYYIESVSFISPYLKSKPEIEVKNFAKNFAELVNQKNLTELKILYPAIAEADSIDLKYNPNEIKIENFNEETYIIRLSPKVLIKVKEDNDGDYKIVSSYGLFAYPQDKMDLAIKTGMFNSNLTDLEFNERIKDNNFFEYLNNKSQQTFKDILFVNPIFQVTNPNLGEGYFEISNKQDFEINGTDYLVKILRTGPEINFNTGEISTYEIFEELPGVNLSPKGKGRINTVYSADHGEELEFVNIIWNNNDNISYDKIIKFKGNEYDEYIKSGGKIILSPEQEAIKFLYTLYYNPDGVNKTQETGDSQWKTYSDSMLDTFKKNNITQGLPKNYVIFSSEWNELSDKIEELEKQSGDILGFDYDIIWDTQDMVVNFEFSILNTEIKNPNLIVVNTKFQGYNKAFTLVKEKGNWRIDNIDNLKESMQETIDNFED